jgi:hypothetical protein
MRPELKVKARRPVRSPRRWRPDVIVQAMLRPTLKTQMALMAKSIAGRMRLSDR